MNAVLIANTYHEFTDAQVDSCSPVANHWLQVAGSSWLIVSRSRITLEPRKTETTKFPPIALKRNFAKQHFEIVSRQDHFIERDPDHESWWLIVARKP